MTLPWALWRCTSGKFRVLRERREKAREREKEIQGEHYFAAVVDRWLLVLMFHGRHFERLGLILTSDAAASLPR